MPKLAPFVDVHPLHGARLREAPHRVLWVLPLGLSLVFMAVVGSWAAANEQRDRQALAEDIEAVANGVQAQLAARLDLERARLRDVALRLANVKPASVDLQRLPEALAGFDRLWNQLVWLDTDMRVVVRADRADQPTQASKGPALDGLRVRSRGPADHLEQPIPSASGVSGAREGRLLARYELADLLVSTDLAWLSGRYEVTFVSEGGEVIATTARGGKRPQGAPVERPLPAFRDTVLRLAPYKSPSHWYRSMGIEALMVGLMGLGVAASMLLRREVRQVQLAGAASRTEAAWRRSMEDSALVGLRARDIEGRILYANRTLCEMVGYSPDELVGLLPPLPFWPPAAVDAMMTRNSSTLAGDAPAAGYETRWQHRNGQPVDVVIFESRLVDSEGRHIGWMGSIVDIGERKRLEELERRHTEALAQHARLNDLGLIASELAHELNQPLAAISGYSTGLKAALHEGCVVDEEMLMAVAALQRNARKAGDIVNWIRRQGSRAAAVREPCALNALIGEVLQARRSLIQRMQVDVQLDLASGLPPVQADRIAIEQVLTNLIRNAADAMAGQPGLTRIEIGSRLHVADPVAGDKQAAWVEITVCDAGPGLQGRSLDELCAAFYSTKPDGMGLGLAISRSIAEAHAGTLTAADRAQGGACVAFSLPVNPVLSTAESP